MLAGPINQFSSSSHMPSKPNMQYTEKYDGHIYEYGSHAIHACFSTDQEETRQ
jgi:hypothetical protein